MSDEINKELSEAEELLLMKYIDSECGFLERSRAERLLERCSAARTFVDDFKRVNQKSQAELAREIGTVNLWPRISQRIDSEEHAELFLGKRVPVGSSQGSGLSHWLSSAWGLGFSGAAVTAIAALFLISPTASREIGGNSVAGEQMVSLVRGVNLDLERPGPHGRPQILDRDGPNVVEVDWMRSDGKVRILPGTSKRSPIIWVRKRTPNAEPHSRRTPIVLEQETPFSLAEIGR